MIDPIEFEGGFQLGPASFVKATGRGKVFASQPVRVIPTLKRPCPICGDGSPIHLFDVCRDQVNTWDYSRCQICGLVYTVNAPTEEAITEVYKSAPAQQAWVALQQNDIELKLDRLKFQWALEWAGWPRGDQRILDVGCSTGTLLEVACGMTEHAGPAGVEINQDAKKALLGRFLDRKKSVTLHNSLEACVLSSVRYDMVVLWEVLEHVLDPRKMLQQASDLVKPGGQILICVPNVNSLAAQVLHDRAPMFGLGHVQFPDQHHLVNLLPNFVDTRLTSIISWRNELINWSKLLGVFDADPNGFDAPTWIMPLHDILEDLGGYKLVLTARKVKS